MNETNGNGFNGQNGQPQQPNQQQNGQQPGQNYQQPAGNNYPQPQQPYYPPQPQPVYYAQPVYVAPKATQAEKDASFMSGGSIFMLILCIVGTINLLTGLVGKIISLDIGGILLYVLEILIVIGMWITFVNAKRKKLSSTGISLIRVPYVIQFVFAVLSFAGNIAIWIITFNIISLIIGLITFVFQCICFASVNKSLILARDINQDKSVVGRKAGIFAAVMLIIFATFDLIGEILHYLMLEAIKALLGDSFLAMIIGGGGIIVIIVAVVAFIVNICGAIVMIKFGNKVKQANGQI